MFNGRECVAFGAFTPRPFVRCVNIARRESVRNISHKYNTLRCAAARRAHVEQVNTINVHQCRPCARELISDVGRRFAVGQNAAHTSLPVERSECVRSKIYGSIHYTTHNASANTINKIAIARAREYKTFSKRFRAEDERWHCDQVTGNYIHFMVHILHVRFKL